jgi:hypothetical protein
MPRTTNLVHPRRHEQLDKHSNFYNTTCTLEVQGGAQDSFGEPTDVWAAVAGLADIPARVSVATGQRQIGERELSQQTYTIVSHIITLKGYYPAAEEKYRAVAGGIVYDIVVIEHDSSNTFTRLRVQKVTT